MIYVRNSDPAFKQFKKIEIHHPNNLQIKKINTLFFLLRRYPLASLIIVTLLLFFALSYPLIAFIYILSSILVYAILLKINAFKFIELIKITSYIVHAVVFINGVKSNTDFGFFESNTVLLGAFTVHLIFEVCKFFYRYNPVYEVEDNDESFIYYMWLDRGI